MIEFNGNLSQKCKDFILRMEAKKDQKIFFILTILATPIIILGILIWDFNWLISVGIVVGLLLITLIVGIPRKKDSTGLLFPTKVGIENNIIYVENNNKLNLQVPIDRVYEVLDMGDWYFIKVGNSLYTDPRFVCQKDLLSKGTIEEFETLFKEILAHL